MSAVTVGVSLKMYFGHRAAREWAAEVADIAATTPAVADGTIEFFIAPSYLQLLPALEAVAGTRTLVSAQDASEHDRGAYTGEVSPAELAEIGVALVELGHAERRRMFGDTDAVVAAKTAAALRNGLTPVLCVGEPDQQGPDDALAFSTAQLLSAIAGAPAGRLVVAYEPVWAIGAPEPARADHVRRVGSGLRELLASLPGREDSAVIYGGSAGPGLLTQLGDDVDGLFLGRFAHDPAALRDVLAEAAALAGR
ncbi:MAG: triose-phosphate isomerase [Protaetiibacter sp.]